MAQQTINVGTAPNDGTGTPLRTAFQYTNSNFSELYTAVGPSGNNIVVPGSATITGDLTVDTNTLKVDSGANKVGIGTTTMNGVLTVKNTSVLSDIPIYTIQGATNTAQLASWTINQNTDVISFGTDYGGALSLKTNSSERYRLASDGVATWSNVGGVAGTAMTLNSTGLGVGIAPDATKSTRLSVYQTGDLTDETAPLSVGNTAAGGMRLYAGVNNTNEYVYIGSVKSGTGYRSLILQPNGGNVGIGVTPSAWSGVTALQISRGSFAADTGSYTISQNVYNNGGNKYIASAAALQFQAIPGTGFLWYTAPSGTAGNAITFTQAMTLDASGRLLVGQTSTGILNINGIDIEGGDSNGGSYIIINHKLATASGQQYVFFGYNGVKIGDITQNGTTGVLYNITSDYRLKEQVQPLAGGLARVNALKPSVYKWKSDGSNGEGFLAHELAEVVPFAVSGEKDAVNEDGSIKSQGIDMSRVVPILVAAIQELAARVQTLETR